MRVGIVLSLLPVLVLVPVTGGCSGGDPAARAIARVDTVGTRVEVTNSGTPIWTTDTAWRFEEDLRLGSGVDGPELEQFGRISSIATDSRSNVYILDGMAQEIRVFEPSGTFSHTIGGRGQGPAEFSGAGEIDIGPGDTLTVLDDGLMRFSIFAPDGTLIGNHRRDIVGTGIPRRSNLNDGAYLDWAPDFPDGRFGARVRFTPILYRIGFERADTFPAVEYESLMVSSGRMPLLNFGGSLVASAAASGDLWFTDSREYRIHRRSLEGDTTLVITLPVRAPPIEESDREFVRNRWSRRPDLQAEQLQSLPDTKPVVYGIVPDNAGHVLVFVDVAGETPGTVLDVFQDSGEYLGRARMPTPVPLEPNRSPVVHATPEHLYVVVKDGMGVPYMARLRIVR